MKQLLIFLFSFLFYVHAHAQQDIPVRTPQLLQLKNPKMLTEPYVNFDVVKITPLLCWTDFNQEHRRLSHGLDIQVLFPKALFKTFRPLHFTWGISVGSSRLAWDQTALVFDQDNLTEVNNDGAIQRTVQRSKYISFIFMPLIQFGHYKKFELFAGGAARCHWLGNKLFYTYGSSNRTVTRDRKYINQVTVPLLLQASYRLGNTLSLGVYGSQDMRSRFKGSTYNVRQKTAGISFAIKV